MTENCSSKEDSTHGDSGGRARPPRHDPAEPGRPTRGPADGAARLLSVILHPVVVGAATLVVAAGAGSDTAQEGLVWASLTVAVATGLPAADLLVRVRTGRVSSFDVALREQRSRPVLVALVCCLAALALLVAYDGPKTLQVALVAALIDGAALGAVTRRWKISFHAAVVAGAAVLSTWALGPVGLPALALLAPVGWARVRLARHTPSQVVAGALLGLAVTTVVVALAGPPEGATTIGLAAE